MKKIIYLIIPFVLFTLINGCVGYEPIFSSTNLQFKIVDYSIDGNKTLGNKIYSQLYRTSKSKKDDQNIRSVNLFINVSKTKDETAKASTGKVLEYKITLNVKIKVIDFITHDNILNQTFASSSTYKVQDQHSETINLENKSTEDLIDKIYQEVIIQLSQNILLK